MFPIVWGRSLFVALTKSPENRRHGQRYDRDKNDKKAKYMRLKSILESNIGNAVYGQPEGDEEYPDSDSQPVDKKTVNLIRRLIKSMTRPIYGPVVNIIDKFVPTAMIIELLKSLKYHGDTLIGDARMKRRLQKQIRKAVVKRLEIKNANMQQKILDGLYDERLDSLRYGHNALPFAPDEWEKENL